MRHFVAVTFVLILAAGIGVGCKRAPSPFAGGGTGNKAEVEKAIREYLATKRGISSDSMKTEVRGVQFKGDTAEAEVYFEAKDNPGATMTMHYMLKRTGDAWSVQGPKTGDTQGHPPVGPGGEAGQAPNPHGSAPAAPPERK